jgi:glycolate oxidase iron-sulfur subunit
MPNAPLPTFMTVPGLTDNSPILRARRGLDACVHCGFCLQACPTYLAIEDENDSPRGRLVLMRGLVEGTLSIEDEALHTHIDRCLGCRACETACPSGVPYGELLEATRATLARDRSLPRVARAILWLFAHPSLLALAFGAARAARGIGLASLLGRLPGRPGFGMAMLAASASPLGREGPRAYTPTADPTRGRVAVLRGCVMEGLFGATNRATVRTLTMNGYEVVDAPGQRCCGALHAHAGDDARARALARINVAAFSAAGATTIVSNAAGCGAMLKSYGHLLADDPAWADRAAAISAASRDVSEVLAAEGGPRAPRVGKTHRVAPTLDTADDRSSGKWRVAYDDPCHLLHAQRVADPPRAMLAAIPWIDTVPLADADQCCGGAGIYNLLEPTISGAVLAAKLAQIEASGAAWVATGNPGCLMQIGAGLRRGGHRTRVVHPVDLLDLAYSLDNANAKTGVTAGQKTTTSSPPVARP